jgi:hypothetical protein
VERLSLLAAIVLVDEQRWDGQERSTRYQNFMKSGWYFPGFGEDSSSAELYVNTVRGLFAAYDRTTAAVQDALRKRVARPEGMKPEAYERTLRARAFDVARYLLPWPPTSLGQIVNAHSQDPGFAAARIHGRVREAKLRDAARGRRGMWADRRPQPLSSSPHLKGRDREYAGVVERNRRHRDDFNRGTLLRGRALAPEGSPRRRSHRLFTRESYRARWLRTPNRIAT